MTELDRTRLLGARLRAADQRPYLASALYALTVVATDAVPTMAVDRHWRCYVSPAFVAATPVEELAGVWLHEVAHLVRDHHGRDTRLPPDVRADHLRVNAAQDCEINDDLVAEGVPLPGYGLLPATYGLPGGRLFEEYVNGVPPSPSIVDCGSGAAGPDRDWEIAVGPRVGPGEADALRRQVALGIAARIRGRGRGTVPAGWRRWAETVLEPVIDWRTALAGAVRAGLAWGTGAVDYTYRRPSRRAGSLGRRVVLPGLRRPLPTVAVVVDTSASMSTDDLAAALAEVAGVLRGVGGRRVTVLACDSDAGRAQRIATVEEVELVGGGGTDMRVGIAAALAVPDPPSVVVVLTDGGTPWPAEPVGARVIAGLIGPHAGEPPDWLEAVHIR